MIMNAQEIRQAYLDFFSSKGHKIIPRALLVPQNDASTLFTGSGMQPMIPYLLGEAHPLGRRLANSQICLRSQDIDDIGDDKHTTSFEMLGNWSLGDYYKQEQISWISEFLFDCIGLDPSRVYVSCYIGNEKYGIPKDQESIDLWQQEFSKRGVDAKVVELGSVANANKVGMQGGRIFLYDGHENWWSRNGDEDGTLIGDPCGPDSEMFYDFGEEYHDQSKWGLAHPASDSPRFFEIGNNVFMGYKKVAKDKFVKLKAPNIDHGSGLERIAAAKLDNPDVFRVSLLKPIIDKLEEMSAKQYSANTTSMRIIADHLRGATFLANDGVVASNKAQGYVLRRLIRRAVRFAFELGIEQNFINQIVDVLADTYKEDIKDNKDKIISVLTKEEQLFRGTLRKGLQQFVKLTKDNYLSGEHIFMLYDTYGFPVELTLEEAYKSAVVVNDDWQQVFETKMTAQKLRSQTVTKGEFKGGLGGQDEIHTKYHTATHLLYKALRDILGDQVIQHGSNITSERLRFDFSYPHKLTVEQLKQVEARVNAKINEDLIVTCSEHPTHEALHEMGALGAFGDRYGEVVKVYKMTPKDSQTAYSMEICGGPHVAHTAELSSDGKKFKIIKESSSSAGIRRIKAVLV